MLSGRSVDIGFTPWIHRKLRFVQVGSLPGLETSRIPDQSFHPLAGRGVAPHIKREELQGALQSLDLNFGDLLLPTFELIVNARPYHRCEQSQDYQDHNELNE